MKKRIFAYLIALSIIIPLLDFLNFLDIKMVHAATARRTGTNESVSTYGSAGRNYTSLATWEDATDLDLVTNTISYVLECYDDAASFNDYVSIAGATTNATYFRIIRPAAGQGHDGTPNNGVNFANTTAANGFSITESYTQVQDIIQVNSVSSSSAISAFYVGVDNAGFVGCIGKGLNTGSGAAYGLFVYGLNTGQYIIDCLGYESKTGGIVFGASSGKTNYAYNCTTVNNVGYGFGHLGATTGGTVVIQNCLSSLNTGADFSAVNTNPTKDMDYCASEDATADDWNGTGNRISQTFSFVNSGGDDWHLTSTDIGARNYGTDLSADATYPFNDDIDKAVRSGNWDIGFDEFMGWEFYDID